MTAAADDSELTAAGLPRSWSREEVEQAFGISRAKIDELVRAGRVGFIVGKNRKRRFMAEHIGQIREAIEVKPTVLPSISYKTFRAMGVTDRSARFWAKKPQ